MEDINKVIGKRIKAVRTKKGLSQSKLCDLINMNPSYISYVENGQKGLSLDSLIRLANALNATADELLQDCLENTVKTSNHEFAAILFDCSDYEKRVLLDVVTAAKTSLRENASRFVFPRR
ncbi:MAG: helix-turn-helix domain-containing protein [Bacteroidaceae bacterium]